MKEKERWFVMFGDGRLSGGHKVRESAVACALARNRVHRVTVEDQHRRIVPPATAIIHAKGKS